jgi:4-cresol dehydrogenase (hydroxylating) flavoprotein subunit
MIDGTSLQGSGSQVVSEWRAALGASSVVLDVPALEAAGTATFPTNASPAVLLFPQTRSQLQELIRIANAHAHPIYPVSTGKNWGYGSRVATSNGCALVDLSRMDQITAFDEALGYVTVQPGVTQRKLLDFLQARNSRLWIDATGSSPDCSLIGNAVERGFGHTPYGDHFANVCGFEVVLANGEVVRTGYSGFAGAKAGSVYRWGVGPSLDGMFSQSNFGIVTEMTIWLMPEPECFEAFFFQSGSEEALSGIVDALRPLRLNGTLRSAIHIGNDYKVLAGISQFPWGEKMPLEREQMNSLGAKMKFSRWSGSGALYGSKNQVKEAKRLVRAAMAGKVDKLQFLNDKTLSLASRFQQPYRWFTGIDLTRTLELLRPVYGLLKGIPTQQPLGSAYWRKRMPVPADPNPDRDRCGVIWLAPVAPMMGAQAVTLTELAERLLLKHGFEPQISITLLTERSLSCVISITYDREIEGEDEKATTCYRDLRDQMEQHGYYSYRLGVSSMPMRGVDPAYSQLLHTLKKAVDPNNILAPGRYSAGKAL